MCRIFFGWWQVNDFKNHQLPLARIKKIMKADEDVRMISAEAPVLFAKACEMFILELTLRSWIHTEENKRRTLQKNDIAAAITRTDIFDFLVDIVPRDELINKEDVGLQGMMQHRATGIMMPVGSSPVGYEGVYYMPQQGPGLAQGGTMGAPIVSVLPQQQQAMGSPSMMGSAMMVARPTMAMDPSLYQQQQQQQQQSYIPQQQPMQQNLWQQQAHMANSPAGMPPNSWHLKSISVDTIVFLCFLWLQQKPGNKSTVVHVKDQETNVCVSTKLVTHANVMWLGSFCVPRSVLWCFNRANQGGCKMQKHWVAISW